MTLLLLTALRAAAGAADRPLAGMEGKKIVLIAGKVSHGAGEHEFRAGCLLLRDCLERLPGITAVVYSNGWPTRLEGAKTVDDHAAFHGVSAVFIYADGGGGHPAIVPERLRILDQLARQGVGIGCAHYAVEVPRGEPGEAMLRWIGGYFEMHWSVNPHWDGEFVSLPVHPITRGVAPFKIRDEWYYHMRFPEGMKNVTPILTAHPPTNTLQRADGSHSGNPFVRAAIARREPQHLMWAFERPGGGRGFGFTGGHFHR
ncbi:MAG TPA: ThuA domain-containing protein, partial [Methylomirabilota bacterium]|nr:ThuA domain-containing protein [Methylomirabilota bacterium]